MQTENRPPFENTGSSQTSSTLSSLAQDVKEKLGLDTKSSESCSRKIYDLEMPRSELEEILKAAEPRVDYWVKPWSHMSEKPELSCDVIETSQGFQIVCDCPGVESNHIQVKILENQSGRVLEIRVCRQIKNLGNDGAKFVRKERAFGVASRSFQLPLGLTLEGEQLQTKLCHGVLCIMIPKSGQVFSGENLQKASQAVGNLQLSSEQSLSQPEFQSGNLQGGTASCNKCLSQPALQGNLAGTCNTCSTQPEFQGQKEKGIGEKIKETFGMGSESSSVRQGSSYTGSDVSSPALDNLQSGTVSCNKCLSQPAVQGNLADTCNTCSTQPVLQGSDVSSPALGEQHKSFGEKFKDALGLGSGSGSSNLSTGSYSGSGSCTCPPLPRGK